MQRAVRGGQYLPDILMGAVQNRCRDSRGAIARGLLALLGAVVMSSSRADEAAERVQVVDPYIELRTGAASGYPVFQVAERGEWIEILRRKTDWFKVRTPRGIEGWVHRTQLENTLTEAGVQKTFRDVLLDDYLRRRLEFGFGWGQFESVPFLKAWLGYKLTDTMALELVTGQAQGTYSGSSVTHLNLVSEPFSDLRLAPFAGIGLGKFQNVPRVTLISARRTDADMANATIGVRYYITERFVARADYTTVVAFIEDNRTDEYRIRTLGLSFFF
jgi:hypothetical protein